MQYLGSKQRIAKKLVQVMQPVVANASAYYEPFVGSASVLSLVQHDMRYASDANSSLISMWCALQAGWQPPSEVTEADYARAKALPSSDPLKAFVGFGCSFGGKWFGGFARNCVKYNYASSARNSLLRKLPGVQTAFFAVCDYQDVPYAPNSVVYCDPPYAGTTQYAATGNFDSCKFWSFVHALALVRNCTVFVSEYAAPPGVECVAEFRTTLSMRSKRGSEPRVERLFRVTP